LLALPAFWAGILYDDASLDAAWDLVKGWTAEDRQKLRDEVPKAGLATLVRGRTVLEIANAALRLAYAGLARRKRFDAAGHDETLYLEPLQDRLTRGTMPAEELLEKFQGPWDRSVEPLYEEEAY
jgi:glutamate--cysteine ligase